MVQRIFKMYYNGVTFPKFASKETKLVIDLIFSLLCESIALGIAYKLTLGNIRNIKEQNIKLNASKLVHRIMQIYNTK